MDNQELEKIGREIAHKCKWSGHDIFVVLQAALEDANFHREREALTETWEHQMRRIKHD
tara:strand:- start:1690 stop:1866 length:177 start_codon:yes stop_codon:yes gene_type:complete